GVIDDTEAQFLRATRAVLWVSLALIIISGVAISLLHFMAGQGATVFTPAYLFKSLLIVLVVLLTALLHTLPETFAEGLLGGTWYALFVVHILAPVTTWVNLFTLYAVWLVGFNLIWYVLVFSSREHKTSLEKLTEKPKPIVPKAPRKPFFSFFNKSKSVPVEPVIEMAPAIIVAPITAPAEVSQIKLDPIPKIPPVAPAPVFQTITPIAPPQPHAPMTIEKLPGAIATDTPFLPQVPPLQPIPVISSVQGTAPATVTPNA